MLLFISFTGKSSKTILWRCVSFVRALFFSVLYAKETGVCVCVCEESLKFREKERTGGNPPCVNKENLSCCFFFMLWLVPGRCPAPSPIIFFFNFLFSLSLLFPRGEKRGVGGGTRRRFEHRHSVYIYQNFFAFDRAIAIKMCSCSCPGLGRLPSSLYFV